MKLDANRSCKNQVDPAGILMGVNPGGGIGGIYSPPGFGKGGWSVLSSIPPLEMNEVPAHLI